MTTVIGTTNARILRAARAAKLPLKKKSAPKKASSKKSAKKSTRRKSSRTKRDDEDDDWDESRDLGRVEEPLDDEDPKGRKRASSKKASKGARSRRERQPRRTPEEVAQEEAAHRTKTILVNACDPEERRVVLIGNDNRIDDLLMTAESQKNLVNDIYRGKVVNLEPAIGAAFVDFGQGRNGFLHTSDVMPVYGDKDFSLGQAAHDPARRRRTPGYRRRRR